MWRFLHVRQASPLTLPPPSHPPLPPSPLPPPPPPPPPASPSPSSRLLVSLKWRRQITGARRCVSHGLAREILTRKDRCRTKLASVIRETPSRELGALAKYSASVPPLASLYFFYDSCVSTRLWLMNKNSPQLVS